MKRSAAALLSAALAWGLAGCGDDAASVPERVDSADARPVPVSSDPPLREFGPPLQQEFVTGRGKPPQPSEAELRDLRQYAKSSGQDAAVVEEHYGGHLQFADLARKLVKPIRDTWVETGISRIGEKGHGWILFTERPPRSVFTQLAGLGTDTNVVWGAPANHDELRQIQGRVAAALRKHGEYAQVTGREAEDFTSVRIEYSLATGATPTRAQLDDYEAQARRAAADTFPDGRLPAPVSFKEVEHPQVIAE